MTAESAAPEALTVLLKTSPLSDGAATQLLRQLLYDSVKYKRIEPLSRRTARRRPGLVQAVGTYGLIFLALSGTSPGRGTSVAPAGSTICSQ